MSRPYVGKVANAPSEVCPPAGSGAAPAVVAASVVVARAAAATAASAVGAAARSVAFSTHRHFAASGAGALCLVAVEAFVFPDPASAEAFAAAAGISDLAARFRCWAERGAPSAEGLSGDKPLRGDRHRCCSQAARCSLVVHCSQPAAAHFFDWEEDCKFHPLVVRVQLRVPRTRPVWPWLRLAVFRGSLKLATRDSTGPPAGVEFEQPQEADADPGRQPHPEKSDEL